MKKSADIILYLSSITRRQRRGRAFYRSLQDFDSEVSKLFACLVAIRELFTATIFTRESKIVIFCQSGAKVCRRCGLKCKYTGRFGSHCERCGMSSNIASLRSLHGLTFTAFSAQEASLRECLEEPPAGEKQTRRVIGEKKQLLNRREAEDFHDFLRRFAPSFWFRTEKVWLSSTPLNFVWAGYGIASIIFLLEMMD